MAVSKKKLEVLFKANFPVDKPSEATIKAYLEESISGIKIKSIETYSGKGSMKAVVTSNIADILLGTNSTEDDDFNDYRRGKSMSFMGPPPGFVPGSSLLHPTSAAANKADILDLELKGKELADMRLQLKKQTDQMDELQKKADRTVRDAKEQEKLMAEQVQNLSKLLSVADSEKYKLEVKNKELETRVKDYELSENIRNEALSIKNTSGLTGDARVEAMEALVTQKQRKFEEERMEIQDKLNMANMRLITEHERTEGIIAAANKAENLEKAVAALEHEKQELAVLLQNKEAEANTRSKLYDEASSRLPVLELTLKQKEAELAELTKKTKNLEEKTTQLAGTVKALETSKAISGKEEAAREKRINALEAEKGEWILEKERIGAELKAAKQEIAQFGSEKDGLRQGAAEQQKTVREKEEAIRELKMQCKEKEGALHDLEAEHKAAEKQVEELKKKLEETEKKCEALNKQLKQLGKSDRQSEKVQSNAKQKIDFLESEIKRKDKEIKTAEENSEQSRRELIVLQARFSSSEKTVSSKNDEIKDLKARLAGGEIDQTHSANSSLTSATADPPRKDSAESSAELTRLRKELDDEKLHSAQLNGSYLETKESFDKAKARTAQLEKEMAELREKLSKSEVLGKNASELETFRKEAEDLRIECKKLRLIADESTSAVEVVGTLQKQHELMVKENTELKAALFEIENSGRKAPGGTGTEKDKEKRMLIIEEIRQVIAEVIYVYKTLDTNAKQFIADFEEKKENLQVFAGKVEGLTKLKKEEQLAAVKTIAKDVAFLRGFPLSGEHLKTMIACLTATSEKKQEKMQRYDDEIGKFNMMLGVSKAKVDEYEQKLSFYYQLRYPSSLY